MVNCFLPAEKLILELIVVFVGDPFLVHDIAGAGFPVALQERITVFPSVFVSFWGCAVIVGSS